MIRRFSLLVLLAVCLTSFSTSAQNYRPFGEGREIWHHTQQLSPGEQRLPINSPSLAPGLYRLRLTLADGRQRVLPLVRQ